MRCASLFALPIACGLLSVGCAAPLPSVRPSTFSPSLPQAIEDAHAGLTKSWSSAEQACLAEDARLSAKSADTASTRRNAELILGLAAGGFALGAAVYTAIADSPSAFVIVPMTGGAAAASAPLVVLIAEDDGADATYERRERIEDRRALVRDAYHKLLEASRERVRLEALVGHDAGPLPTQLAGARSETESTSRDLGAASQRVDEARVSLAGDKPAPEALAASKSLAAGSESLDAARAANDRATVALATAMLSGMVASDRDLATAVQRETDAAHALHEAIDRLSEICFAPSK